MDQKAAIDTIIRSQDDKSIRKTSDYVNAHFSLGNFSQMTIDVGPYCNLRCPPCYANCSPKELNERDPRLDDMIIEQAIENKFDTARTTDGEPIVEKNKYLLKGLFEVSDKLKTIIVSNATFGNTDESLLKWLQFFQEHGWNFDEMPSHSIKDRRVSSQVRLSQGGDYPKETRDRLADIIYNFKYAFGLDDVKDHIKICKTIGKNELTYGSGFYDHELLAEVNRLGLLDILNIDGNLYFSTKLAGNICFEYRRIKERGRGKQVLIYAGYKTRNFFPSDLGHTPHPQKHIHIDNKGDVGHGYAAPCVYPSRQFGNLLREPLDGIIYKIVNDPVFWIHKLGSVEFTYHLAREFNPDLAISAIDKCGVCKRIFRDEELMEKLGKKFKGNFEDFKDVVAEKYLEFAEKQYG